MRRHAIMLALVAATVGACQILVGIEDEIGVPRPDAGESIAADADDTPEDPCRKHHPPPPPSPDALPKNDSKQRLIFAIRSFSALPGGKPNIGYDLDGRCTGDPNSTTSDSPCKPPGDGNVTDQDGGIDNALGKSFGSFSIVSDAEDPIAVAANRNIERGRFTNIIALSDYNGEANDDDVGSLLVMSYGLSWTGCNERKDSGTDDDPLEPKWDGCDAWSYAPGFITRVPEPIWEVVSGYVTDNQLVVRGPRMKLGLLVGELEIHGAVLTARIERKEDGTFVLKDGIVAGRADASNVIAAVQYLEIEGEPICKLDDSRFELARSIICKARDLPLSPGDDGKEDQACNALSFAFGFEAELAELGEERDSPIEVCNSDGRDFTCPD